MRRAKHYGSYTSGRLGVLTRLREGFSLYRVHRSRSRVTVAIAEFEHLKSNIESLYGEKLTGKAVLDIGPGQFLIQSLLFAAGGNDVTAIDLDVIPFGFDISSYAKLLRMNGSKRAAKTIARKLMGIDAAYRANLSHHLQLTHLPAVRVVQGDVTAMRFEAGRFDFVHCSSVLQSIFNPESALREITRVTKSGGIVYATLHCYTSHNGSLDPRVIDGNEDEALNWMHLREKLKQGAKSNAFLNRLRVHEWEELFRASWLGCHIQKSDSTRPGLRQVAERFIAEGEIQGYTVEELLCHRIDVFWKKPE